MSIPSNLATVLANEALYNEPVIMLLLGDSTANWDNEWAVRSIVIDGGLADRYPDYTFRTILAIDSPGTPGTPVYSTRSVVRQVGTNGIRHVVLNGTSQYITAGYNPIYSITGSQTHSAYVYFDPADPGSGERIIASRWPDATHKSWKFGINYSGNVFAVWTTNGSAEKTHDTGVAASALWPVAGWKWIEMRLNTTTGSISVWSSDDAVTWTEVGTSSVTGAASVYDSAIAGLNVGCAGVTPGPGSFFKGKIAGYQYASGVGGSYSMVIEWCAGFHKALDINTYNTVRSNFNVVGGLALGGSPEFILFNNSIPGKATTYHDTSGAYAASAGIKPNFLIVNHGHNQSFNTTDEFAANVLSLVTRVLTDSPHCDVSIMLQNPERPGMVNYQKHNRMMLTMRGYARQRGWTILDGYSVILSDPNWQANLMLDDVHPNSSGMDLMAVEVVRSLLGGAPLLPDGGAGSVIYPVVERSPDDVNPIYFEWPTSADILTVTMQLTSGGTTGPVTGISGTATFHRTRADGVHLWKLAFHGADRPSEEGLAVYRIVGSVTRELTLRVTGGGGGGNGARTVTITVTDGAAPLQNATVRLTEGINSFTASTDANGIADFNVDDATYAVAITKAGYSFGGAVLVVDGDEAAAYAMTLIVVVPPGDVLLCAVTIPVRDQYGQPLPNEPVEIRFNRFSEGADTVAVVLSPPPLLVSGPDGNVHVELMRESEYSMFYGNECYARRLDFTVPDSDVFLVGE